MSKKTIISKDAAGAMEDEDEMYGDSYYNDLTRCARDIRNPNTKRNRALLQELMMASVTRFRPQRTQGDETDFLAMIGQVYFLVEKADALPSRSDELKKDVKTIMRTLARYVETWLLCRLKGDQTLDFEPYHTWSGVHKSLQAKVDNFLRQYIFTPNNSNDLQSLDKDAADQANGKPMDGPIPDKTVVHPSSPEAVHSTITTDVMSSASTLRPSQVHQDSANPLSDQSNKAATAPTTTDSTSAAQPSSTMNPHNGPPVPTPTPKASGPYVQTIAKVVEESRRK